MKKALLLLIFVILALFLIYSCSPSATSSSSSSSSSSSPVLKIINTVAGTLNTTGGSTGDTGLATSALLNMPMGVYVDSSGNIFIADYDNFAIREVTKSDGKINTVAGTNGTIGHTGDGAAATSAYLNGPMGVCVDSSGNIFIADTYNHAIREVYASGPNAGKIFTVAGTINSSGNTGDTGLATSAKLNTPGGVFVDSSGNIFIADTNNHVIREVDHTSHNINTVAGVITQSGTTGDTGLATSAKLNTPEGVFVDSSGNIFIADNYNNAIRKVY